MKCCVEGCERDAHYKAAQLCQMHYFRQRRYGTTETVKRGKAKPRQETPQGYQWVYEPTHPLRHRNSGYVAEHRAVLYADLGDSPLSCELCGISLTWATCHVDHIDADVRNNTRANLRPTCCTCNGKTLTAAEWVREPGVTVSRAGLIWRLRQGWEPSRALFQPGRFA